MKKLVVPGLLLTLALAVSAAQATQEQPQASRERAIEKSQEAAPEQEASPGQSKQQRPGVEAGTRINATLESALDARTAKPGDEVTARVTHDVKQDGQVVIHKGDRLLGQVTAVEASGAAGATSQLAVTFDRLLQGETSTQLNTIVTAVLSTPAEERERQERMMSSEPEPMMRPSAPARRSGRSSSSGGLVGGATSAVGSTVGAASSTLGGVTGQVGATSGAALGSTTGAGLSTPARALRVESGAQAEHQSGLSSVFSTRESQLRLESGTRLRFEVAGQAAAEEAGREKDTKKK